MEKVDVLQVALVAFVRLALPRFMRNIAGWRETGDEMAGNGGLFIKGHQLMETEPMINKTINIWLQNYGCPANDQKNHAYQTNDEQNY